MALRRNKNESTKAMLDHKVTFKSDPETQKMQKTQSHKTPTLSKSKSK